MAKDKTRADRKLALKKQTLRKLQNLSDDQLAAIAGGIDRNGNTYTCCCRSYWG